MVLNGDPKGKNILYCNGNSVIIRDIENPGISDVYTQHSTKAIVARYAPSGFYIASGDASGKIRIWDTTQKEHILKYEYQPISGKIKDIVWSPDSKRIAVCGEGREKFGHVFLWDSGSSVGEIMGHSKFINAIDYRPVRPFRVVTAGEDKKLCYFEGPPFRYKRAMDEHTRFVNTVRYSPGGEVYCSGGADGKAILFDGKTGDKVGSLGGDKAHSGGIYALSFGPDGKQVLTASGDKTCKIWDVETTQVVTEFSMGNQVEDQQVGCLWQGSYLLSVSLTGYINYLDVNNPGTPLRVLKGQNKNLTALTASCDKSSLYAGSMDGRISSWKVEGGEVDMVSGSQPHTNCVVALQATQDRAYSLGLDKKFRSFSPASNEFDPDCLNLPDRDPLDFSIGGGAGYGVVITKNEVVVTQNTQKVSSFTPAYEPVATAFSPTENEVAIGGKDNSVHIYTLSGDTLSEKKTFSTAGEISAMVYSPDAASLAVTSARSIVVYNTATYEVKHTLLYHTARCTAVDWSPDSKLIVSGSIDTNICVWDAEKGSKVVLIKSAHPLSVITGVSWISNTMFASCGHDCCIRVWEYTP